MIIIPTIVLAEVMYICQKGRITLTFRKTLTRFEEYENFEVAPLDVDILKAADNITVDLEMHDKLIVATALYLGTSLITRDESIRKAKIVKTVW